MTEVLERLRGYFLEVEDTQPRPPVRRWRATMPEAVGLVGPPRLTVATGAALALALARGHRARCGLLCRFVGAAAQGAAAGRESSASGDGRVASSGGAPAALAARRAAAALRAREVCADSAGRLVRVALDEEPTTIADTVARAAAVVPGPIVLAIDRARDEAVDRALAQLDLIAWIAPEGADTSLLALVTPSLAALGPPAVPLRPPSGFARRVALAGLASPGLTAALIGELDGAAA